jgi:hypothetical protein
MTPKKLYFVLTGAGIVSLFAIVATIYFANTLLQKSSNQLVSVKLDNRVIEEREKYLLQAKKELDKYKDLSATLQKVLPKDKDEARAVAELYRIADESGLQITRISFPASTLGQKSTSKSTSSSSAAVTQAKPLDGVQGALYITTQIEIEGKRNASITYPQIIQFLKKLEQNRRNMQVSEISVNSTEKSGELTASVGLNIFVKP